MLLRFQRLTYVLPDRLARLWRDPGSLFWFTAILVAISPILGWATYYVLGGSTTPVGTTTLRSVLLADVVYILVVLALVASRVGAMVAARRRQQSGSRLHIRLTGVFALMALFPTVLVALFATITINFGVEGWFSERVRSVVGNSLNAAQAYESEHRESLSADARVLAEFLNANKRQFPLISAGELRELLTAGQQQMRREVSEAFMIDGTATLRVRGALSYLFDYEAPGQLSLDAALASGEPVIIEDWDNNEFRALVHLDAFADRYLYVTREVDGGILDLLDETQSTVALYQQLEGERGRLLFELALLYLGFATIIIFGAIWLAFWFGDRLSRPVVRLVSAAERVGQGDLSVRVREGRDGDEIATLSKVFNRMTGQVERQRDALIVARNESDNRRQVFEAVLSGVSAGVIGLDEEQTIEVVNDAATDLLLLDRKELRGRKLVNAIPQIAPLLASLDTSAQSAVQDQIQLTTGRRDEDLLVRITRHPLGKARFGYVITFDSITDLVAAQRMAAWGDVARRIAHEIKNPLTPIQLSAERMKRKYARQIEEGRDSFENIADVIVRQTNDLRRIVDEFSKFARLPKPVLEPVDIADVIKNIILLQNDNSADVSIRAADLPMVTVNIDPGLIGQALTNILKNAVEAVEARLAKWPDDTRPAEVIIALHHDGTDLFVDVKDTGIGLPVRGAGRLFEPYVTHREGGTGLGLAIVKKIAEDHDGSLTMCNRDEGGAMVSLQLPLGIKQNRVLIREAADV